MSTSAAPETVASLLTAAEQRRGLKRTEIARLSGLGSGHVSMVLNGDRARPDVDTLERLAVVLKLTDEERRRLWTLAGYPTPGDAPTVERAIEIDPYLTEEGKRVMLGVYYQIRREPSP